MSHVEECEFVKYNLTTRKKQGEVDVLGLNLKTQTVYICEVATHTQGLEYTKNGVKSTVETLEKKFLNDVEYAQTYLANFTQQFMFWSPIVRLPVSDNTKHNTFFDLAQVQKIIHDRYQINIEMVVNENYLHKINELKSRANKETSASEYPVFRMLQIINSLEKHVKKLTDRGIYDSQEEISKLMGSL
ncbi:MAG: hypothetical protein KJ043_03430 [Anaerolineae bacterium]|nr:hypothetical protein [Anaerolineae bacterium]